MNSPTIWGEYVGYFFLPHQTSKSKLMFNFQQAQLAWKSSLKSNRGNNDILTPGGFSI